jgi:hypothetical protein
LAARMGALGSSTLSPFKYTAMGPHH